MAFGERLLRLLEEREITQKKFAAMLNIAPTTLNGYIKSNRQPDFELVKCIASTLGVSTDYLLDYNGDGINLTEKELSAIIKLRSLDRSQQDIIYNLIDITATKNDGH
ncbi:MAG: helix-turn-helix transcriptional regulator [Ruminiclostridium sp.]|nr:helix-turn-helix transcriptional regulator [Ruminiclostridium sp.]